MMGIAPSKLIFFDQTNQNKYNNVAHELVASSLIIKNSLSSKTRSYLKYQYVVNQSNYSNTVVAAVAMIASFGSDGGDKLNKTMNETTEGIVSIHLADYVNKCSQHNDDGSVESFESIANDGRTIDNDDVSIGVASELENDNIDDNVITSDDDDGYDEENNDAEDISGDDNDDDSSQEDSVSANDNTNSITNPANETPPWILLVVMADDDDDDNPDDYNDF